MKLHGIEIEFTEKEINTESKKFDDLGIDYFDLTDLDNGNCVYYLSGDRLSEYLLESIGNN